MHRCWSACKHFFVTFRHRVRTMGCKCEVRTKERFFFFIENGYPVLKKFFIVNSPGPIVKFIVAEFIATKILFKSVRKRKRIKSHTSVGGTMKKTGRIIHLTHDLT